MKPLVKRTAPVQCNTCKVFNLTGAKWHIELWVIENISFSHGRNRKCLDGNIYFLCQNGLVGLVSSVSRVSHCAQMSDGQFKSRLGLLVTRLKISRKVGPESWASCPCSIFILKTFNMALGKTVKANCSVVLYAATEHIHSLQ